MAFRSLLLRRLSRALPCRPRSSPVRVSPRELLPAPRALRGSAGRDGLPFRHVSRSLSSGPLNVGDLPGPAAIDYRSLLQEDEFHRLAESTIHDLQEKFEDYGDNIEIDGFDIDYGNDVLTLKLGELGTYVLNKQTPNRQIWLSSPVSGPSRFDWDQQSQSWVYRRTKANLLKVLETELEKLCGQPISLS
ncbi:frataxin, mitochondrial [Eucalyptus grandis]|uniref:frataxin, mitochondrial n=1 Tax=Eucalyptus grandis TaxID=71139 RepID=UPI00192E8DE9|nr:frataxin, mitochondrial [Eucalyptus grandis]